MIEDDWHAHLADVLGGEDPGPQDKPSHEARSGHRPERLEDMPSPVVPLSRTLAQLAAGNTNPEEEDDDPVQALRRP